MNNTKFTIQKREITKISKAGFNAEYNPKTKQFTFSTTDKPPYIDTNIQKMYAGRRIVYLEKENGLYKILKLKSGKSITLRAIINGVEYKKFEDGFESGLWVGLKIQNVGWVVYNQMTSMWVGLYGEKAEIDEESIFESYDAKIDKVILKTHNNQVLTLAKHNLSFSFEAKNEYCTERNLDTTTVTSSAFTNSNGLHYNAILQNEYEIRHSPEGVMFLLSKTRNYTMKLNNLLFNRLNGEMMDILFSDDIAKYCHELEKTVNEKGDIVKITVKTDFTFEELFKNKNRVK